MENLIFSLNATVPIFIMMILGYSFYKIGLFDEPFADKMNKFVFKAILPVLLFKDLAGSDFYSDWDMKFVLFCFAATVLSILAVLGVSFFLKEKSLRGEFVQASYRSSAALLGVAFIQNIYGEAGPASLMIIGAVPLYNIAAVTVLAFLKPDRENMSKQLIGSTLKEIVTNPLLIGIAAGICWSLLKIPRPVMMEKTLSSFASLATPLGLMAMGATFDLKKAMGKWKPALLCSAFKLVVFVAAFLPLAVWLGFRTEKLVAILVMLGAATTVSCFVMARNMGHEGTLTSSTVMLTTLLSAFTITGWLYLVKSLGLI